MTPGSQHVTMSEQDIRRDICVSVQLTKRGIDEDVRELGEGRVVEGQQVVDGPHADDGAAQLQDALVALARLHLRDDHRHPAEEHAAVGAVLLASLQREIGVGTR